MILVSTRTYMACGAICERSRLGSSLYKYWIFQISKMLSYGEGKFPLPLLINPVHNDKYYFVFSTVATIFLTSHSAPVIGVYLLLVIFSRHLMKLFSPFNLRRALIVHNLLCTVFSFYAAVCFIIGFWQVCNSAATSVVVHLSSCG